MKGEIAVTPGHRPAGLGRVGVFLSKHGRQRPGGRHYSPAARREPGREPRRASLLRRPRRSDRDVSGAVGRAG